MMKKLVTIFMIFFSLMLACCAVKKQEKDYVKEEKGLLPENRDVVKKLYIRYKNGMISKCTYNGQTVYCATLNAYDASSAIYDGKGNEIGRCNYAYNDVDSICRKLTDCEVIYRVKSNIWGDPAVDKYGLNK